MNDTYTIHTNGTQFRVARVGLFRRVYWLCTYQYTDDAGKQCYGRPVWSRADNVWQCPAWFETAEMAKQYMTKNYGRSVQLVHVWRPL